MQVAATSIISAVLALGATILVFIFFVPKKRKARLNGFGKFIHSVFNFNELVIEKIMHALYVLSMCFCLIFGCLMLFSFEERYHYGGWYSEGYYTTEWVGYYGLLVLVLGPIAIRIAYEVIMMAILAVKNIIEINQKLKNQNEEAPKSINTAPAYQEPQFVPPTVNQSYGFCPDCGEPLNANGICSHCGR